MSFNPDINDPTEMNNYLSGKETELSSIDLEITCSTIENSMRKRKTTESKKSIYSAMENPRRKRKTKESKKSKRVGSSMYKREALMLQLFRRNKKEMPPKKEYLRCRLIRGQKRFIRKSLKKMAPLKGFDRVLLENSKSKSAYESSLEVCNRDREEMERISDTMNGPKTDGKSKRSKKSGHEEPQNSFNDTFCQNYFEDSNIKEHFYYYNEILFADFESKSLCERFDFKCCEGEHKDSCKSKWKLMKIFTSYYMLKIIGVDPWFPKGHELELSQDEIEKLLDIEISKLGISTEEISKQEISTEEIPKGISTDEISQYFFK
ncbi:unnamed protein product [Blepharisma stoltei]|uniref:Uncharacterized protein n=1 Tax=Blepharisma stoltei TaxID=1481888 RepID=A0AAU9JG02_9CILI|nr:unnamed protein product [Blepharisma stoltei]